MDVDLARDDWPERAACRWAIYLVLWSGTVVVCLLSAEHLVFQVGGSLLGCLLAVFLPLTFATLFETAYSRRARQDLPLIACPCLGAIIVLLGVAALQQASPLLVWSLSHVEVDSPAELCERIQNKEPKRLPRTVCMRQAFLKTDWEAGKLECRDLDGHVKCTPEFVAAPIFNDKAAADEHLPEAIHAWGVTHGPHVVAGYRQDGSLCGYLHGAAELDYYLSTFHVAVDRLVDKYRLVDREPAVLLGQQAAPQGTLPLHARPIILVEDPKEMSATAQAWLMLALLLLGACPCVGPVPLGFVFCFWCWSAQGDDRYHGRRVLSTEDYDDKTGFVIR